MKIGILETGGPPKKLAEQYGSYDLMFRRFLGDGHEFASFSVFRDILPSEPSDCDAYVVTGSAAGVHDKLPWIGQLIGFLRAARGNAKLVGICFGHQVMAEAFGGMVAKSENGWGLGHHTYQVLEYAPWMDKGAEITVPVVHQDQVIVKPPAANVLASSPFTPYAGLAYQDQPAISFQCHPEFSSDYTADLVAMRGADVMDNDDLGRILFSLGKPNDNARVRSWVNGFLSWPK